MFIICIIIFIEMIFIYFILFYFIFQFCWWTFNFSSCWWDEIFITCCGNSQSVSGIWLFYGHSQSWWCSCLSWWDGKRLLLSKRQGWCQPRLRQSFVPCSSPLLLCSAHLSLHQNSHLYRQLLCWLLADGQHPRNRCPVVFQLPIRRPYQLHPISDGLCLSFLSSNGRVNHPSSKLFKTRKWCLFIFLLESLVCFISTIIL